MLGLVLTLGLIAGSAWLLGKVANSPVAVAMGERLKSPKGTTERRFEALEARVSFVEAEMQYLPLERRG